MAAGTELNDPMSVSGGMRTSWRTRLRSINFKTLKKWTAVVIAIRLIALAIFFFFVWS